MRHQQLPEGAVVDERLQLLVFVIEAPHEPDLDQLAPQLRFPLDDLQGGGHIGGQRLLAHHRLAGLQARQQLLLVGGTGGGEDDGVDIGIGDRVERIVDHPAAGIVAASSSAFSGK